MSIICFFCLFFFTAQTAPIPPNYALVPLNFYWDALPSSIPVLQSYHLIVTNVARLVNYGALGMADATFKCLPNAFGFFTGNAGKRTTLQFSDPTVCGSQNKTVSQAYTFYIFVISEYPELFGPLSGFMNSIGLDVSPDTINQPISLTTDVGIGLLSGRSVAAFAAQDGVNSQGNYNGEEYNVLPFADYTNYGKGLDNTAFTFSNCNEWQPSILPDGTSTGAKIQAPMTPQTRFGWNLVSSSQTTFITTFPRIFANCKSLPFANPKRTAYLNQAYETITRVGALNDYTKMQAELFQDKLNAFFYGWATFRFTIPGPYTGHVPWESDDDMYFLAVGDSAGYAAATSAWSVKFYTQSVRPRNIIRHYLATTSIASWGGSYKGTVPMNGSDFETYLPTENHPEYPSGTTCYLESLVQSWKLILGLDTLPFPINVTKLAGSSVVEPGIPASFGYPAVVGTPSTTITLLYHSLSDYAYAAGESRKDIGVHFAASVNASRLKCPDLGTAAFNKVQGYLNGTITTLVSPSDRDHYSPVDLLRLINWFG